MFEVLQLEVRVGSLCVAIYVLVSCCVLVVMDALASMPAQASGGDWLVFPHSWKIPSANLTWWWKRMFHKESRHTFIFFFPPSTLNQVEELNTFAAWMENVLCMNPAISQLHGFPLNGQMKRPNSTICWPLVKPWATQYVTTSFYPKAKKVTCQETSSE